MGSVIFLIGRLCSGKTTYARRLEAEGAILLSCDTLMQTLFPEPLGDAYDVYSHRAMLYLYAQAKMLAEKGCVVVLDFGFWRRSIRREAQAFFAGIPQDWRYLCPDGDVWKSRIQSRNEAVTNGTAGLDEYFVDEGLLRKLLSRFEEPAEDEGLAFKRLTDV